MTFQTEQRAIYQKVHFRCSKNYVVLSQRTDVIGEKGQIPTDFVKIDKRNAQKGNVEGVDLYFQDIMQYGQNDPDPD